MTEIKQKRVTVYLNENDYKTLRAKLILLGKSVSGWLRKIIADFIKEIDIN